MHRGKNSDPARVSRLPETKGYGRVVAGNYDAEKGDSGAAVLSADGTQLLGLHIGGWSNYSVFCRFDLIAAKLGVEPY